MSQQEFEDALPDPEFLIKSIAEQGYSLETALADLIDNSIAASAQRIEILIDTTVEPFTLFLADDGKGMDEFELRQSMKFPSNSPEAVRSSDDLGRFGLGLKTASFSQTRHLTVLSRKKGQENLNARSWNVNALKDKQWKILVESPHSIGVLYGRYKELSSGFLNEFEDFKPNTIVVWRGLYKFENYLADTDKSKELKKQVTDVTSQYLSIVFHRFLERRPASVKIRINNTLISPFNPFPPEEIDFRKLESNRRQFQSDNLRIEGFILPSRSLDESKGDGSVWVQRGRSLTDMEGMYIYRGNRIILHGGWNGIIKKNPRLQLARLKVDIGNSVDNYFHLNVAKSSIAIPPDLRMAFIRYVNELRHEAEREYYNKGLKKVSVTRDNLNASLFVRFPSDKGMLLKVNEEFPLLKDLKKKLSDEQTRTLAMILKMIDTTLNKIRQVHEDKDINKIIDDGQFDIKHILDAISVLRKNGISSSDIQENFLVSLGLRRDSIPEEITQALKLM
jgi:hypothetical protein